MTDATTAPLDCRIEVMVTRLEYVLLVYLANKDELSARDFVRALLTDAVRNQLHADLKKSLLARGIKRQHIVSGPVPVFLRNPSHLLRQIFAPL